MANKGLTKLWKKLTGGRQKDVSETVDERVKEHDKLTEDRVRELDLAKLLTTVELSLDSSTSNLSADKIEELRTRSVLKRTRYEMVEHPVVTKEDLTEIDHLIKCIVYEIKYAVEKGYETSAHWSTVALALANEALHIPVPENALEYSAALMEKRREYARNLRILTQDALHYDEYTAELATHNRRYDEKDKEIKILSEKVQAIIDSREGPRLLVDIRNNADDLAKMQPAARELRDMMRNLHLLKRDLLASALSINTAAEQQRLYDQRISQMRNIVAIFPRVEDPKLAAKNQEAAEKYADELRNRLNRAEAGLKAIDANLSELINLGSHSIFQKGTSEALEMYAELRMREFKEKEAELEATRAAIREKEQAKMLKKIERNLAEELNRLAQEDEDEVITVIEEQVEQVTEDLHEAEAEYEEEDEDLLLIEEDAE
ncbi:MAG: hypothetical protein IJE58_08210 [Oscillospiraceae bacterium]|nr:hypothetical protein [Oscillospiraceae bacterium]